MATTSASSFPKMGEEPLTDHLVNASGDRSPYTLRAPKSGPSGDVLATGGKANRGVGSMASGEHSGPTFRPVATLYAQNAAAASDTGRGMRTVPSKVGVSDFWTDRSASQSGRVI